MSNICELNLAKDQKSFSTVSNASFCLIFVHRALNAKSFLQKVMALQMRGSLGKEVAGCLDFLGGWLPDLRVLGCQPQH